MSLIVKIMHSNADHPGDDETAPCSIYDEVTSIHFPERDTTQTLRLWVREPVKTAMVPGFCENEKNVDISGPVYVMNEHGKTISVYRPPVGESVRDALHRLERQHRAPRTQQASAGVPASTAEVALMMGIGPAARSLNDGKLPQRDTLG